MLESYCYKDNAFVSLTYDDENLKYVDTSLYGGPGPLPTLHIPDYQNWLKRLRKEYPRKLRFYLAGEYGPTTWRPHYHAALFNFPTCSRGRTRRRPGSERAIWRGCCYACELVGNTWGKGDVDLGTLEPHSCGYVAGYVLKKMTRRDDVRLFGRFPEFARQSNRRGIGYDFLWDAASSWMQFDLSSTQGDVPVTLRHGRKERPLGRYLRQNLRKMIGKDEKTPPETLEKLKEEMRPLREAQFATKERTSLKSVIQASLKGKIANAEARRKIYKRNEKL